MARQVRGYVTRREIGSTVPNAMAGSLVNGSW
jgi:hypothetical protein